MARYSEIEVRLAMSVAARLCKAKRMNYDFTSYSLKHWVEFQLGLHKVLGVDYISNASMIEAMRRLGFASKTFKEHPRYKFFNVTKGSVNQLCKANRERWAEPLADLD